MNKISSPWLVHFDWLLSYCARMPEWRTEEQKDILTIDGRKRKLRSWLFTGWWLVNFIATVIAFGLIFYFRTLKPFPDTPYLMSYFGSFFVSSYILRCTFWNYLSIKELSRFRAWRDHHLLWWKCITLPYSGHPDGPIYRTIRFFEPEY